MKRNLYIGILALMLVSYPAMGKAMNVFEITYDSTLITYLENVDYAPFANQFIFGGEIYGPLQACSGLGCYGSDFGAEFAGEISLIERGTCTFNVKVRNSENAGAVAAIVYNNVPGLNYGDLDDGSGFIPQIRAISVSQEVGMDLLGYLDQGDVTVHLRIDTPQNPSAVPEPTTVFLFGAGLVGLAGFERKKFKK